MPTGTTPMATEVAETAPASYVTPQGGGSLLISLRLSPTFASSSSLSTSAATPSPPTTVILVGADTSCAPRVFSALEASVQRVVVLVSGGISSACDELRYRAEHGQIVILDLELADYLEEVKRVEGGIGHVKLVCVTDTTLSAAAASSSSGTMKKQKLTRRTRSSAESIHALCKQHCILVNIHDMPDLCDFTFPSTHRFPHSSLQLGVTTNGMGCRLAGRIKRQLVASLPKDVGEAVMNVGKLRGMAKAKAPSAPSPSAAADKVEQVDEDDDDSVDDTCSGPSTPNRPVPSRAIIPCSAESSTDAARRRMKWVAQISEYYPLSQLARLSEDDMQQILAGDKFEKDSFFSSPMTSLGAVANDIIHRESIAPETMAAVHSPHSLDLTPPSPHKGRVYLVGSGPGHPSLLTLATHSLLTRHADLVLADKLVPQAVLDIIPSRVQVRIARKFPGNAEAAQMEMMEMAVEGMKRGLCVVRLKQGDPSIYGRAGEELLYIRSVLPHHPPPLVVPGISSALAAPTFANIPVTQRGAADSFVVCTGVGRGGKKVVLPGYVKERTLVVLMGVARIADVVKTLTAPSVALAGAVYPSHLPIAIIERGSMPDQRVIKSTLRDIQDALVSVGEQRPPGMFVIGWSVMALDGEVGNVDVLDDREVVRKELMSEIEEKKKDDLGEEEIGEMIEMRVKEREVRRVRRWLGEDENGVTRRWVVGEGVEDGWQALMNPE